MQRIAHQERPDWQSRAERNGFKFHTIEGERYWDERHYYAFTLDQVENDLEAPTEELHHMCLDLVGRVVRDEQLLKRLGIQRHSSTRSQNHGERGIRTSMAASTWSTTASARPR